MLDNGFNKGTFKKEQNKQTRVCVNPSKSPPLSHTTTAVHRLHLWSLTRGAWSFTLRRATCESVRRGLSWRQRRGAGFRPDHSWRTGLHSRDGRCWRFDSLKLKHSLKQKKVLQLRYCVVAIWSQNTHRGRGVHWNNSSWWLLTPVASLVPSEARCSTAYWELKASTCHKQCFDCRWGRWAFRVRMVSRGSKHSKMSQSLLIMGWKTKN